MSEEHRVECNICMKDFRPIKSQIRLICSECYVGRTDASGKKLIGEFLSKKTIIPLIAKIIEKETTEEYCSSEIIAELIYDKLKEERRK